MNTIRFILSIAAGLIAHQTNPLFEHLETAEAVGAGWYRMARYGVGYLAALPSLLLLFPAERRRVIAERYLSNAVLFGFGVAVGYVIDMFLRKKEKIE